MLTAAIETLGLVISLPVTTATKQHAQDVVQVLLSHRAVFGGDGVQHFQHMGGGRKGVFLVLRYVFIVAAAYLLIFSSARRGVPPTNVIMIAFALASNVALSLAPADFIFTWYVEAPVLVADTLWVSWALHSVGTVGQEFFLLYFFVLSLAALGESFAMVLLGSTLASVANVWFISDGRSLWASPHLLRIVFFYTVALFYGYVFNLIKHERQRADTGFAWAKELEAKVDERTAELSRLYRQSLASNQLKSELMANISHELRTPLNIIIGYAEMLLAKDASTEDDDRTHMMTSILEAARNQAHLVENVLSLGKAESGRLPVHNEAVPLHQFVADLQQRERLTPGPQVALRWEVEPVLPVIETDTAKLAVILDNLINNAIKFTTHGHITVAVRDLPGRQQVEFRVEDTGPGIDQQDLPTIFEAFHQGHSAGSHGGVGLGLAIVRRYTDLISGEIAVRSVLGKGSCFTLALPYRAYPANTQSQQTSVTPEQPLLAR